MFRSYDHRQGLLLCLCNILLIGVHASLYFGVWPYVICVLCVRCTVPFGVWLYTGYVPFGVWLYTGYEVPTRCTIYQLYFEK
jgi:hypothetical protein